MNNWIGFRLGGEAYVHSVHSVKEVLPFSEVFPVPGTPTEILGVLNIRGEVVTIVSGHQLLGLSDPSARERCFILVLELSTGLWGVLVDAVTEIMGFDDRAIDVLIDQQQGPQGERIVQGTMYRQGQLNIVADFAHCCEQLAEYT
ncbi:chemotaxis protein CheW [Oceanospirillum beijerinckii]|uniref:chemotaxis protein CheW n=1 Tax=Oceanospirillum beijerinckii TaxID=64976 RepID=UPI000687D1D6|nr:chemotaxis protein CheW [Oceanospirillum beijerinckii]